MRTGRIIAAGRRMSLYLIVPALSAIAPLIAIPAITGRYGVQGWAVVAVALSVGATAAVVCDLGWGTIGPQLIARDPAGARIVYESSLASKALAFLVLAPVAALVAALPSHADRGTAAILAIGTLLAVMSPTWYFIGQGRPGLIMWTDTVPRLVISSGAALAIALGAPLLVYGIGVLMSAVVAMVLAARLGGLPLLPKRSRLKSAPAVIRGQLPLVLGNVMSTAFTSAPAAILAHSAGPAVIATFSAVDRPMRLGLNVLGGVPARLQSWVGTPDAMEARRRSKASIGINLVLGVVAAGGFFVLAPPVAAVLFSGSVDVDSFLALLGGVLAGEICFSRGLGLALVAADRANRISLAVGAGAAVGVVLLVALPGTLGAGGALLAVISAEAVMIIIQILQLRAAWSKQRMLAVGQQIAVA